MSLIDVPMLGGFDAVAVELLLLLLRVVML